MNPIPWSLFLIQNPEACFLSHTFETVLNPKPWRLFSIPRVKDQNPSFNPKYLQTPILHLQTPNLPLFLLKLLLVLIIDTKTKGCLIACLRPMPNLNPTPNARVLRVCDVFQSQRFGAFSVRDFLDCFAVQSYSGRLAHTCIVCWNLLKRKIDENDFEFLKRIFSIRRVFEGKFAKCLFFGSMKKIFWKFKKHLIF